MTQRDNPLSQPAPQPPPQPPPQLASNPLPLEQIATGGRSPRIINDDAVVSRLISEWAYSYVSTHAQDKTRNAETISVETINVALREIAAQWMLVLGGNVGWRGWMVMLDGDVGWQVGCDVVRFVRLISRIVLAL